jgi:hypothetical protein
MSLLEPEEENADDVAFDEDSKIRLFETQQRSSKSVHEYVIKFLPVGLIAIVIIGAIIWLMQPGIGDPVAVPSELKQSVYDYMSGTEKRSITEIGFYKCSGYYWVKILAEPRAYPPSNLEDAVNQYRLEVRSSDGKTAEIKTLPAPANASNKPCDNSFIAD